MNQLESIKGFTIKILRGLGYALLLFIILQFSVNLWVFIDAKALSLSIMSGIHGVYVFFLSVCLFLFSAFLCVGYEFTKQNDKHKKIFYLCCGILYFAPIVIERVYEYSYEVALLLVILFFISIFLREYVFSRWLKIVLMALGVVVCAEISLLFIS